MKKYLVILPLFFLAAPVNAYDFGAAGYIAAIGATAIGVAAFIGAAPALATLAIGAGVMGITFDKTESTGSPLVVQVSPAAKLATPEGWTTGGAGQSKPNPPATAPLKFGYKCPFASAACAGQIQRDTVHEAALDTLAYLQTETGSNAPWTLGTETGTNVTFSNKDGFTQNYTMNASTSCPAGYSSDGVQCNLITPDNVMKPSDGACGITRVGNSFSTDAQDPDCSNMPASTSVQPNSITQTKPDGSQKSVTINPDGSVTATDSKPDTASNTTQVNTTQLGAPDASGVAKVSGQGTGATNGTGTANSGAPTPTFDKTGLATEGTLKGIKDLLSGTGADSTLGGAQSGLDAAAAAISDMFGGESAKDSGIDAEDISISDFLPTQCGCTPLTVDFHGIQRSFNWCPYIDQMKSVFAWVISLMTAFYVLALFRVGKS